MPWYAADQNPAAAENAVAGEWWWICWLEEDLEDASLLLSRPISLWQPLTLLDIVPSELHELFDVIADTLLDPVTVSMVMLLFDTVPLQSSVDAM